MSLSLFLKILLALLAAVTLAIYLFSRIHDRRYWFMKTLWFSQFVLALIIVSSTSSDNIASSLAIIGWAVFALMIIVIREMFFSDLRLMNGKYFMRQRMSLELEHHKFEITTDDNVSISGFHIQRGFPNVIILAHGGFRSKNTADIVFFAEWLSTEYDVVAYDARGHFESGGYWQGDSRTVDDLRAVRQYVQESGYSKIGFVGRSLGGWTGLLYAAEYNDLDSMVIISAPLGNILEIPLFRYLRYLNSFPGRFIMRMVTGVRSGKSDKKDIATPSALISKIRNPVLMIYSSDDPVTGVTENQVQAICQQLPGDNALHIFPGKYHLIHPHHLVATLKLCSQWFEQTIQSQSERSD